MEYFEEQCALISLVYTLKIPDGHTVTVTAPEVFTAPVDPGWIAYKKPALNMEPKVVLR